MTKSNRKERFVWEKDSIVIDEATVPSTKARKTPEQYVAEYQQQLQDMLDDDDYSDLDYTRESLKKKMSAKLSVGLGVAATIGLAGAVASKLLIDKLTASGKNQLDYFDGFVNDLTSAVDSRGDTPIEDVIEPFKARIGTYAGAFWEAMQSGVGDAAGERRVKWELDPLAKHCEDCPNNVGIYSSFQEMEDTVGVPGSGQTACLGNCRCKILVETEPGSGDFVELFGRPSVYTAPIIPLGRAA